MAHIWPLMGGVGSAEGEAMWALWEQMGAGAHAKGRKTVSLSKWTQSDFATSVLNTRKQWG